MANRWGNNVNSDRLYFLVSKITADGDYSYGLKRRLHLGRKAMTNLESKLKSRDILSRKRSVWAPKNWCFWAALLEKTLESPLNCKEIQPVHPKGDQSCIFTGRTDAEAETPILWPPDAKSWLFGKDPDAGKDWRQEQKEITGDEMVRRHHRLDAHEFEQALGVGDGQWSLACCNPLGCKELDTTEWLNWTELWPVARQMVWAGVGKAKWWRSVRAAAQYV